MMNLILFISIFSLSSLDSMSAIPYGVLSYHITGYSTIVRFLLFLLFFSYLNLIIINKSYYRYARITYIMITFMLFFLITLTAVSNLFLFFLNLEALTYTMIFLFVLNSERRSIFNSIRYFYLNVIASSFILLSIVYITISLSSSSDFLLIARELDLYDLKLADSR